MATWLHTHLPRLSSGDTPDVISVKVPGQHIEYASWVSLANARFVVSEKGRQRTLLYGVRNVHAWIVGDEILRVGANWTYAQAEQPVGYRRAVYDPWQGGAFVDFETKTAIYEADLVIMAGKNVYYVPTTDTRLT
jgi:hypothetical protein